MFLTTFKCTVFPGILLQQQQNLVAQPPPPSKSRTFSSNQTETVSVFLVPFHRERHFFTQSDLAYMEGGTC